MRSLQALHGTNSKVLSACLLSGVLHRVQEITAYSVRLFVGVIRKAPFENGIDISPRRTRRLRSLDKDNEKYLFLFFVRFVVDIAFFRVSA
jgi:hypothetical protein